MSKYLLKNKPYKSHFKLSSKNFDKNPNPSFFVFFFVWGGGGGGGGGGVEWGSGARWLGHMNTRAATFYYTRHIVMTSTEP